MQQMIFIADLIACSTCFGHHYAHHQELESIIQVVAACHTTLSSTPYRQLENQAPNTTGSNHLCNTLELLMMGIMVPETCWASNKICNKNHLLHLVGILFRRCTVKTTLKKGILNSSFCYTRKTSNSYCQLYIFVWSMVYDTELFDFTFPLHPFNKTLAR